VTADREKSLVKEYKNKFPHETSQIRRIEKEESEYKNSLERRRLNTFAFLDEEITSETFDKRWENVSEQYKYHLDKILSCQDFPLDALSIPITPLESSTDKCFQTMRTTTMPLNVKYIGSTIIHFESANIIQALWGDYSKVNETATAFYFYNKNAVTCLRNKLIYHLMNLEFTTVTTKSILQICFSSCWDKVTLDSFHNCIDDIIDGGIQVENFQPNKLKY
jgi:hypothetical protein